MAGMNGKAEFPKDIRSAARWYIQHELTPLPAGYQTKVPIDPRTGRPMAGWETFEPGPTDFDWLFPDGQRLNIAILNGSPSANHVDVDIDSAEARTAADLLLPPTEMVFGRSSSPRSHRIYQVDTDFPKAQEKFRDLDGTDLLELRGSGGITIYPPSCHEDTGEAIAWDTCTAAAQVGLADLRRAVAELAAAAILARHWPAKGSLHDARLHLTGGLLRAGWSQDRAEVFLRAVAAAAGNTPGGDCRGVVETTARKLAADEKNVTRWPSLEKLLGEKGDLVVKQVRTWLGLIVGSSLGLAPWPTPVYPDDVPEVPAFPLQVLPAPLRDLVAGIARALSCPPDYAAIPLLTLAGGAIANSRSLAVSSSHFQAPCLYAVYIGSPGTKKGAPLKILRRPFDRAQWQYIENYKADLEKWKQSMDAGDDDPGPKPVLRRCIVSDSTTESLSIILGDNPRGVLMIRNELSGWMAGMNQYKGGRGYDRQFYLDLWDGETIYIDRKSDKDREGIPLHVKNPFTAIIGNMQPTKLDSLHGEPRRGEAPPDDGFMDRFLFSYPDALPAVGDSGRTIPQGLLDTWGTVIDRLLGLAMGEQDKQAVPLEVTFTPCGRVAWERFTWDNANEINAQDFPAYLKGPWSKMYGYGARLALILHYLRWVTGESNSETVDGESMRFAAEVVAYFKAHARKVYHCMGADPHVAAARRILDWITKGRRERFQKTEAHQDHRALFRGGVKDLAPVLTLLENHYLIRQAQTQRGPGAGRNPSPWYEVNPHIFLSPENTENTENSPVGSITTPNAPNSQYSQYSQAHGEVRDEEVP